MRSPFLIFEVWEKTLFPLVPHRTGATVAHRTAKASTAAHREFARLRQSEEFDATWSANAKASWVFAHVCLAAGISKHWTRLMGRQSACIVSCVSQ
jgi:hypothetical protein